jgi:hypothetical protein
MGRAEKLFIPDYQPDPNAVAPTTAAMREEMKKDVAKLIPPYAKRIPRLDRIPEHIGKIVVK